MNRTRMPRLSTLALCACASIVSAQAHATVVLSALTASTIASANGNLAAPGFNIYPGYAGSFSNSLDAAGQASSFGFASDFGAYAVRSGALGIGNSSAAAGLLYTVTNTSGQAQQFTMSFHIYGGSIATRLIEFNGLGTQALTGGETLFATYAARVLFNGNEVFSSSASLLRNASGPTPTLSKAGTTLLDSGDDGSDGEYSWGDGYYSILLPVVAAGQVFTVLTEVEDSATANVGVYDFGVSGTVCNDQGGYGGSQALCFKGEASSFYGDPVDFNSSNNNTGAGQMLTSFVGANPNNVPEPATVSLVGLAILGAVASTRRRRRSA